MSDGLTIYVSGPRRWSIETHNMDGVGHGRFSIHEHIGVDYAGAIATDVTSMRDARRIASQPLMEEALLALSSSENGEPCWCPSPIDEPYHIAACIEAKRALAAAAPPARAAADGRREDDWR